MDAGGQEFRLRLLTVFGPAIVLFAIGALTSISVPGVYMDAVNPDYMIVRLLNPEAAQMPVWALPGTMLFGRLPTFGAIYHGALPYYIGLPFYTLFGTGVVGIRITNMAFGLIVLVAAGAFMWAFRVRPLIASICLALLALDPGFLFSFRTQFYITLLPIAALLASAAIVEAGGKSPTIHTALGAGLLAGLACYGYFIHVFFVPAVAIFTFWRWYPGSKYLSAYWIVGFIIGVLPYAIGLLLLMVEKGGPGGLIAFIMTDIRSLGPNSSVMTGWERIRYFTYLLNGTTSSVGPTAMMLGKVIEPPLSNIKSAVLFLVPVVTILTDLGRERKVSGLLILCGIVAGFFVLVMSFGNRLWFHHAAPILPVLYVALALSLERFASLLASTNSVGIRVVVAVLAAPFLFSNATTSQAVFLQLEATGGTGLSSDAITRFSEESLRGSTNIHRFFPDWGVFMQFAMITRGTIPFTPDFQTQAAKTLLCNGKDVEVVTMATQPEQRLRDWATAIGWPAPTLTHYAQRDGVKVLQVARWHAAEKPIGACGG